MNDITPKKGLGCFFCGEPDHSLKARPDEFYKPCVACAAMMRIGLTLIGSKTEQTNVPPIATSPGQPNVYPTGRWVVLDEPLATKVLGSKMLESMKQARKAIIPDSIVESIQTMCGKDFDASYLTLADLKVAPITPK